MSASERAEFVAALRQVADLIESDESLPVPFSSILQAGFFGARDTRGTFQQFGQAERFAMLRRFASRLGVDVIATSSGAREAREARLMVGPITYLAHVNADRSAAVVERVVPPEQDDALMPPPAGCCPESERLGGPCAECRHGIEVGDRVRVRAPEKFAKPRSGVVTAVRAVDAPCPIEVRLDGAEAQYYYFAPRQITVTSRAAVAW